MLWKNDILIINNININILAMLMNLFFALIIYVKAMTASNTVTTQPITGIMFSGAQGHSIETCLKNWVIEPHETPVSPKWPQKPKRSNTAER